MNWYNRIICNYKTKTEGKIIKFVHCASALSFLTTTSLMLVLWPCPNFVTWHSGLEQTLQKKAPAATGSYIPVLLTHHVLLHLLNTIGTIITGFEHPVFPLYFLHPWLLIRNVILEVKRQFCIKPSSYFCNYTVRWKSGMSPTFPLNLSKIDQYMKSQFPKNWLPNLHIRKMIFKIYLFVETR